MLYEVITGWRAIPCTRRSCGPRRCRFSGNAYYLKLLNGTFVDSYKTDIATLGIKHQMYGQWDSLFGTWSSRLGFKFSF